MDHSSHDLTDTLGAYSNVSHAVHNFAWSQLKRPLEALAYAHNNVRLITYYKQEAIAVERFIISEIGALQEAFPGRIVPFSVLETVHRLIRRRTMTKAAIVEYGTDLVDAKKVVGVGKQALSRAIEQFRKTMVELAEVPEAMRETAKCRILDLSNGTAGVYFGEDSSACGENLGYRIVHPDGTFEPVREPKSRQLVAVV